MKELYADFNDCAEDGTLPLTCVGSVTSIAVCEDDLESGEEVWLSDGDLRVRARVERHPDGSWVASSEWAFANRAEK